MEAWIFGGRGFLHNDHMWAQPEDVRVQFIDVYFRFLAGFYDSIRCVNKINVLFGSLFRNHLGSIFFCLLRCFGICWSSQVMGYGNSSSSSGDGSWSSM